MGDRMRKPRIVRLTSEERRAVIVAAIQRLAVSLGTYSLNHDNVAEACDTHTSRHTVKHYFRTKQALYDVASDHLTLLDNEK